MKKLFRWHAFRHLFKLGMVIDANEPFILILVILTLIQGHKSTRKQKLCTIFSPNPQTIWLDFGILFRFISLMTYSIYSSQFNAEGRKQYSSDILSRTKQKKPKQKQTSKDTSNLSLHWGIYRPISFKLYLMIETTEHYHFIPVWMTLTLIHGHSCMTKSKNSALIFSQISQSIWMKFYMLPQSAALLKLSRIYLT